MTQLQLHILRHGETEENVAGILQGHLPGKLTSKGIEQAMAMRDTVRQLKNLRYIVASDLQRTVDTAQLINASLQIPVTTSTLLRERDWGELTGRRIAEIDKDHFPPTVETVPQMMERARIWLNITTRKHLHENLAILVVSHGLFSRCLLAMAQRTALQNVPRLQNCELRTVNVSTEQGFEILAEKTDISRTPTNEPVENSLKHGEEN